MLVLATQLPVSSEFFPLTQRDQFAVEIYLPESASIAQTNEAARKVEAVIRALSPHVDAEGKSHQRLFNMRTIVGGGGSRWYLAWEPENLKLNYAEIRAGKISLAAIATVKPQWRPETIDRRDGNRTIEVRSRIDFGASGNDITIRVFNSEPMKQLKAELPPGFRIEIGGALEESMKAQWKMFRSFGMSFIAIILLLIFQFNSLARTSIIIVTLPLALAGGPLWQGLAWLLIFGLTFATVLTLFVIPALYSFLSPPAHPTAVE
ncbi:multidrug efflux protein [Stieleria maiorica]|uniref:Multidrug efflux protein n=1 Tax=Stieleria maiorica TaxID=2795974 RepID=A0A5B9MS18_9BACT|nr:efflux RND transporter permease subunit [Stieleria maiorica]QEG02626.1 multidrug efflux protein [Stieleria maiorica]